MKESDSNGGLSVPKSFYVGTYLNMALMQDLYLKKIEKS